MNKNEFIIEEGAISMREVANRVFFVIKEIVRLYCIDFKGIPLKDEEVGVYIDEINEQIKKQLFDTKISPCLILFNKSKMESAGTFDIEEKQINLNTYHFLLDDYIKGGYIFKPFREIKLNDLYNTIEHELIHQKQDEISKGKYLVDRVFGNFVRKYIKGDNIDIEGVFNLMKSDPKLFDKYKSMLMKFLRKKYGNIIGRKKQIDFGASDEKFLKDVTYYNTPGELNAHAKNVVNEYIKNAVKKMKGDITKGILVKRDYTADEVRMYILPFLKSDFNKDTDLNVGNKFNFKNKLISYYIGYKYLTVENKKKWWRYVFQLFLNYKFDPIILKKED